jgi:RND family efflux transporter MFP subunit
MNHPKQSNAQNESLESTAIDEVSTQATSFEDSVANSNGSKSNSLRWLALLLILGLVGIGSWILIDRMSASRSVDPDIPVAQVKRINLRDTIIERGTLSSQQSIEINCEMDRWENKIISILPEGTVVKKGQVVVRFDSSRLEERIAEYNQHVAEYRSALQNAKEELIVQKKDNESAIRAAEQALDFAEIDRDKYLYGDFKVSLSDIDGSISEQKATVVRTKRVVDNTRILVEKGFVGLEALRAREQELQSVSLRYDRDMQKRVMLLKYDHPKMKKEHKSKVKEANFKLKTEKALAKSRLAQKKQAVEGKTNELKLREDRLKELKKSMDKAIVKAPASGTLAYSHGNWRDDEIREGGIVHEGQTLMYLPNMRSMQVEVGVHESLVSKVKPKQPAAIRIDSYPGIPFTGSVKSVAPLADSGYLVTAKNYKTIITIDEIPDDVALKPGMTAQVELLIGYYPDVVVVPVQAVASHNDRKFVYRKSSDGQFERTEIEAGRSNISFLEVTDGLSETDEIALDAFQRAADDFGDLENLAESTLSKAAESLNTDVLSEIEKEEQKAKRDAENADKVDPEAPPTVIETKPDPEAPPTVDANADIEDDSNSEIGTTSSETKATD